MTTTSPGTAIGQHVPRVDAHSKVSGKSTYAADLHVEDVLWAKTVRSPYSHARIISIDTSAAMGLPGVQAVVTGNDLPPNTVWGRRIVDVPVLAQGIVRFAGEQVAAVVADDKETAQRGVELVEVEYEELTPVLDPESAMAADSPLVHPEVQDIKGMFYDMQSPQNHYVVWDWVKGDVDAGFKDSDIIIENTYTTPVVHQVYMEPHNQVTLIDDAGVLHVWAPSKAPYSARNQSALALGIDPSRIVYHPVTIGGDFGGKGSPMNVPLGYFLNQATGKPVRMVFDYTEEFMAANPRHASTLTLRTGVKRDGTIVAHDSRVVFDGGAYAGFKPAGHLMGVAGVAGPYKALNARIREYMVYTNNLPCGHMRGPGEPQALWALESHIDEIALQLGIDPVAYRLANLAAAGEPVALGEIYEENRSKETLQAAVDGAGYATPNTKATDGMLYGRGVAMGERAPGGGQNNAQVTLHQDGSVSLETPLFEQGSGGVTVLQQMVAETMGLPTERVKVNVMETGLFEADSGTGGSRVTNIGGIATNGAVKKAQAELFKLSAELDNWPEEQLEVRGDLLVRTDTGESKLWKDVVSRTTVPVVGSHTASGRGSDVTGFCAQVAEVAVDPDTGHVKLLKITTAHDTARIINPMGHQGQINGGTMFGIGYALFEELKIEDGHVETLSFADYKIPNIIDIPHLTTVLLDDNSQGAGPYNIKAIGETPNAPTAPAIANAVADAIGVRIRDLPITAEKVYAALQSKARK
jgi:CO/xanthine dehydrogenase Mo-binding subunit